MPGAQPRQSPQGRQGSSIVRGTRAAGPGAHRVSRVPAGNVQAAAADAAEFERTYWQVTRNTSQNFGNGLAITWTAAGASLGDTSWHSASLPSSVVNLLTSAAYSVQVTITTATNPGIMTVQVHAAASLLSAGFVQVGSSLWCSYVQGVIVPDQVSDHTVSVTGSGSGADFTVTSADMMFFKL